MMKKLRVGDLDMALCEQGSGPVLLLVHGFPLDHQMWSAQIDAFSDAYRVIAPDLRGFGATGLTTGPDVPEQVTMEQMADDLAALLDVLAIDEPVHYCGLSMGGYVAWQFWRKYPERLQSLVLCDTRAVADDEDTARTRRKMAAHVLQYGTEALSEIMIPNLFARATLEHQPEVVEPIRQTLLRSSPQTIAAAQRGLAARPDVRGWLGQIELPVLLVVGEEDKLSPPAEMRSIAAALPQAEIVEVPGAGHMAPLEQPDIVNQAIRQFLEHIG